MKEELEEITVQEINRIGYKMEINLDTVLQANKDKDEPELKSYITLYTTQLQSFNAFVRESNMYLGDHKIKYYRNKKDDTLSYKAIKIQRAGFLK